MSHKHSRPTSLLVMVVGGLFGMWAFAALIGGLYKVDWQVTELVRHYLVASGLIRPIHTVVDFYTHIKGIEYIICVVFFVAFSVFFRYVEKPQPEAAVEKTLSGSR